MVDETGNGDGQPEDREPGDRRGGHRANPENPPPGGYAGPAETAASWPQPDDAPSGQRCDFCRLPVPAEPVHLERDGVTYAFCSESCRDALVEGDQVFTAYHGSHRLSTGLSVLDASLPQGMPRNAFVVVSEMAGSRIEAVLAELAWRALRRGEPVAVVTFLEPPVSVIQEFVEMGWNVLPALERGDLQIVDCFTYRVADRDRMSERMNAWNRHLWDVASDATTTVRDPTDVNELQSRIDGVLEERGMHDRGLVVIDSLTELGSLTQPVQAYDFVKDVRADVSKGRFVPIFAGATVDGDGDAFPHDLDYMVDGLVDLRLTDGLVENAMIKQLRVRKMRGVVTYPTWQVYEFTPGTGAVSYDPFARTSSGQSGGADAGGDAGGAGSGEGGPGQGAGGSGQGDGRVGPGGGGSGQDGSGGTGGD